jgi:RNA polymerase sigma factor (sigma-70 family)
MTLAVDEDLVARAQRGERAALEDLLGRLQAPLYALAVRALGERTAAEDATQEILLRVARGLGQFRGDARFGTWVFRVATNHLKDTRRSQAEERALTFGTLAAMIDRGVAAGHEPSRDPVLVRELMLSCTQGMLLCLDRDHRLAFVLGEMVELSGEEAAAVLELDPATYRKRLERARERLTEFLRARCGLANPVRPCRCDRQVGFAAAAGWLDPGRVQLAEADADGGAEVELRGLLDAAVLFRRLPPLRRSEGLVEAIRRVLAADKA